MSMLCPFPYQRNKRGQAKFVLVSKVKGAEQEDDIVRVDGANNALYTLQLTRANDQISQLLIKIVGLSESGELKW